jgi:hypothetical protein
VGTPLDSHNVRRDFCKVTKAAGLGERWVPKKLRTSFVSLMSHRGVSVEEIARLAGHSSSRTTETIYRRELRPVITTGAEVMDQLLAGWSGSGLLVAHRQQPDPEPSTCDRYRGAHVELGSHGWEILRQHGRLLIRRQPVRRPEQDH